MKNNRSIFKSTASAFIVSIFIAAGGLPNAQGASALADQKLKDLCLGGDLNYTTNKKTGLVNFVGAQPGGSTLEIAGITSQTIPPEQAARGYLAACGQLFGLKDESTELEMKLESKVENGSSVLKFQQIHLGIPVLGGEMNVQLADNNGIQMVNGGILPDILLDTTPKVSSADAQLAALKSITDEYQLKGGVSDRLNASTPEKWIYNPELIGYEGSTALVWRIMVTQDGPPPIRQLVLVDAHNGEVLLSLNQLDRARNRMTYDMNNSTTYPGTLRCNEANANCTGGDKDEVNAHVFARDTWNFYKSYHARDSINGLGMTLNSHVHYDTGYCNAFWDGSRMTYGDGCFIVVDDVVAHELTHGVTQYESNLVYANQSGAINESFSDIWGEFVDLTNGKGTDTPAVRWLMGEDTSIGAIRNMKNPPQFNDPDRMGSPLYYKGTADNGGVHTNSGVGNKAAYLATDGAIFNGYTVIGIGIAKTAKIFYKVQKDILTSNATYASLGTALSTGCNLLVGTSSITTANCDQVRNATYATEMVRPAPAPVSPSGTISDTTPTYTWTKLNGATQYQYAVYQGITLKYQLIVASSVCGATTCAHTPITVLPYGSYQWKVRALVGGVWKPFSALRPFKIEAIAVGFNSQFTSDAAGWTPVNGSWSVGGGVYKTPGVANSFTSSAHNSNYTTLTYQVRMYRTGSCINCTNGILIRGTPTPLGSGAAWSSAFSMHYTNSGFYSIWSYTGGVGSALLNWTTTTAIVKNGWNTLKVSINSTNGFSKWYINNTLVASGTLTTKPTGRVGVWAYRDSNVGQLYVDYATLVTTAPTSIVGNNTGILFSELDGNMSPDSPGSSQMAPR
jgi:Zn-dependent metalloprotease